jgi:DNA topoisomerase-3
MTDESIRKGMAALQPGEAFTSLYASAKARSEADWLVGLNATRLITLQARRAQPTAKISTLSVGRVQTPTLALIVARDRARAAFTPVTRFGLEAEFCTLKGAHYKGKLVTQEREVSLFGTEQEATQHVASLHPTQPAVVVTCETTASTRQPPQFFDLTSLQREANIRLGFSAQHTLDLAQSLYEKHKLLTYPRTDSRHITPDLSRTLIRRVKALHEDTELGGLACTLTIDLVGLTKRLVDSDKVSDHHAILPTEESSQGKRLSKEERALYELVAKRMMAALSKSATLEHLTLLTRWQECDFLTRGTQVTFPGWMAFERPDKEEDEGALLPEGLEPNARVAPLKAERFESTTRAPAALTEASLLQAMESAGKSLDEESYKEALQSTGGLGTPATRASMIETLLTRGYIERKKKSLMATPLGHSLITALEGFPSLTSAELTGRWEVALEAVAAGKLDPESFTLKIEQLVKAFTTHFTQYPPILDLPRNEALASCPVCKRDVFLSDKVAWCEGRKSEQCTFMLFRTVAGKTLSEAQMRQIVEGKRTRELKGFKSKAGHAFAAMLEIEHHEERGWRTRFVFPERAGKEVK